MGIVLSKAASTVSEHSMHNRSFLRGVKVNKQEKIHNKKTQNLTIKQKTDPC